MSDTAPNSTSLLQRLTAELMRDKKRTFILSALLVAGLVFGGRAFMGGAPSQAAAAPEKKASSNQPTDAERQSPKRIEARRAYLKGLHGQVTRDAFEVHPDYFVQIAKAPTRAVATTTSAPADRHRELIEAQAARLTLQTIMYGSSSMVSIDGQILRVGQTLKDKDFQVVEIKPACCVLMKEGVTVELKVEPEGKK